MTTDPTAGAIVPQRVFVISPIGAAGSPERLRADRFLKYIVRAALPAPSYVVERADEHDSPLAITAAMLSSIVDSDICVADITGRNPNVFYELALAHAMDKHVVIMDGDKERSPFDIQDQRAIKYGLMPDEIEEAVTQLKSKAANSDIPSTFRDMMNPVASAFRTWTNQQKVESSGDSAELALMRMVERLEEKVERFAIRPQAEVSSGLSTTFVKGSMTRRARDLLSYVEASLNELPAGTSFIEMGEKALWHAERDGDARELLEWMGEAERILREMEKVGLQGQVSGRESKHE